MVNLSQNYLSCGPSETHFYLSEETLTCKTNLDLDVYFIFTVKTVHGQKVLVTKIMFDVTCGSLNFFEICM